MAKFAVNKIDCIRGRQDFYDLLFYGKSQWEKFKADTNNAYESEIKTILSYMDHFSNGFPLPETKYKDLTPKGNPTKIGEFKSKHVRAYCFHEKGTGKMIALWGVKTEQKQDIQRFKSIVNQYYNEHNKK